MGFNQHIESGTMEKNSIHDRLIKRGTILFNSPKKLVEFTREQNADLLLNDLEEHPHAFVLACVMDRQVKAERAWIIPYRIYEKLKDFSMQKLCKLSQKKIRHLMTKPESLHRFVMMAGYFYFAVQRIQTEYAGDASLIWTGKPSSAEVVYRFLEFDGVGPKIATMAANILARDFKIPLSDYFSIDISADVHIKRVFSRLGLCPENTTVEQVIYRARALHPKFPGMMDLPCWEIGRNWCKSRKPNCVECYMKDLCPTAGRSK